MPRIRQLKPEFFLDEELAACSFPARLMFEGLWCQADREGRLEDRPLRLKAQIFPYDNVDADALLGELVKSKHIYRYESDGKRLIQIRTFTKHQKPHVKEPESVLAQYEPGKIPAQPVSAPIQHPPSRSDPDPGSGIRVLDPDPGSGDLPKPGLGGYSDDFEVVWAEWPKKQGKGAAFKAYAKAKKRGMPNPGELIEVIRERVTWDDYQRGFIHDFSTWLNADGWNDERPAARAGPMLSERERRGISAARSFIERHRSGDRRGEVQRVDSHPGVGVPPGGDGPLVGELLDRPARPAG